VSKQQSKRTAGDGLPESELTPRPGRIVRDLATVELTSADLAREINRDSILELVRAHQPVARVDLARKSGLQNSTVSSIVEQLLADGWICEGEAIKTARGRRPTHITLNDQRSILVADVHPNHAFMAVVDLSGHIIAHSSVDLAPGAKAGVRDLANALSKLRDAHPDRSFQGIGISLPGRIDTRTDRLIIAPNLDWLDFDIRNVIEFKLGIKVDLENDANAALLAELWFGHLDGVRNAALLAISEGVGASLLADGHLISGRLGIAGEFGHVCYDPAGPMCGCGRRGCWELFASSTAALRTYRELDPAAGKIEFKQLCTLAAAGNPAACQAIEHQAGVVGRGLRMVTAALSPEVILFAGDITYAWSIAQPILQQACEAGLLGGTAPKLVCAGDGDVAQLLGGAAVVLQRHPGYYRSRTSYAARKLGK
jgi:predicted NBD/HSP70 family sugar kinase